MTTQKADYNPMNLKSYIQAKGELVHVALKEVMSFPSGPFDLLVESMNYSLFAGGKKIRPVLCLAACELVGGDQKAAMPFACALEMIHTYSLIHDDLPCMDNDDMRRGRPTNHKVYGDAQALLAGNALLTLAGQICLESAQHQTIPQKTIIEVTAEILRTIGALGVMGGQSLDILWEGRNLSLQEVETVCHYKTATLIASSVRAGAMVGGAADDQLEALSEYGRTIGLAFQVVDDILNVSGDSEKLGKSIGTDQAKGKTTFPLLLGLDGAKEKGEALLNRAIEALKIFGDEAWMLRDLADYIVHRDW